MAGTGQEPQSSSPPGWYPDPWSPVAMRWWSGRDWTAYTTPRASGEQTEGFAVASLVTSLAGIGPVGIVLGFIARRRIARDPSRKTGRGLATGGIAVGFLTTALSALAIVLFLNGAFDQTNADDYYGTEQEVARTIDHFEDAWDDDDGTRICSELFTEDLAASYQGNCPSEWDDGFLVDMDVESISVYGNSATVEASDSDVLDWTFEPRYVGGEWRICNLVSD